MRSDMERIQQKLIERNGTAQKKPKKKKMDLIIRGVLIYWVIFVVVAWVTFWIKDAIPDTLVQYGLGGGAVELLISGAIEIFRDKMNKEDK